MSDLKEQLERYRDQLMEIAKHLNHLDNGSISEDVLMVADALGHSLASLVAPEGQIAGNLHLVAKEDPVLVATVLLNGAVHAGISEPWAIQARNILRWKTLHPPFGSSRPTIVCLCGSTRFGEEFREANLRETLSGRIVLTIGCDMRSDADLFATMTDVERAAIKRDLDELHKRKIDLADEVLILNVGGYIGESTRNELEYAQARGKRIRFLEEPGKLTFRPITIDEWIGEWQTEQRRQRQSHPYPTPSSNPGPDNPEDEPVY